MYKTSVNKKFEFEIDTSDDQIKVDQQLVDIDYKMISRNKYHVLYNHSSYTVELVLDNNGEKRSVIKVNGTEYEIEVENEYDQMLINLGLKGLVQSKLLEVKAPMPGLVLNVLVEHGQVINKGDNLLVLEAMKMENMIKSITSGKIKEIKCGIGDKVEKNQVLILFDGEH
jgi:biotin carboxyl carrier protein